MKEYLVDICYTGTTHISVTQVHHTYLSQRNNTQICHTDKPHKGCGNIKGICHPPISLLKPSCKTVAMNLQNKMNKIESRIHHAPLLYSTNINHARLLKSTNIIHAPGLFNINTRLIQ